MYDSAGANLPSRTIKVMNLSAFVTNYWYLILLAIVGIVGGLTLLAKTNQKVKYALTLSNLFCYTYQDIRTFRPKDRTGYTSSVPHSPEYNSV